MTRHDATPAYRGYRLQALYTLMRVLGPRAQEATEFQLEGQEDIEVWHRDEFCQEVIQVKSYDGLVLSNLEPSKQGSFFWRSCALLGRRRPPEIKLVNFGAIGPEMKSAWNGEEPERSNVIGKLQGHGYTAADIEAILTHVGLEPCDEEAVEAKVLEKLQGLPTGIDPRSAFELLLYWLYLQAERRARVTRPVLIEKITNVGRFLAETRAHHREWFTSIVPLTSEPIPDKQTQWLKGTFYDGIHAQYQHILANLDFRRHEKMTSIREALKAKRVVIVHAASGQGKSTLGYRYMHDHYPETWRFSVTNIDGLQHASSIAVALEGHARAVQAPMGIYIDVSHRDTTWPRLVQRLWRCRYFEILVTIREEDLKRANISGAEFEYAEIDLPFEKTEARQIYDRAIEIGQRPEFIDFEAAWSRFGGRGPLMEFIYLLTHTITLRERLQQQVNSIRDRVRLGAHADELTLLRLVATASEYEARLDTPRLVRSLDLPDPDRTLQVFENEYLVRQNKDEQWIAGLHPIRSRILVGVLTSPDVTPWIGSAKQALPLMLEEDLETFLLYAFVERRPERNGLLEAVRHLQPSTWRGVAGVFRALLWVGVRDYVEANKAAIEEAHARLGPAWWFVVDLDPTGVLKQELSASSEEMARLLGVQSLLNRIRANLTPKNDALLWVRQWLHNLQSFPKGTTTDANWAGLAELCFWAGHLDVNFDVDRFTSLDNLSCATTDLPLTVLADLSAGLHASDPHLHAAWMRGARPIIEERLADEYNVLALEDEADKVMLHFVPFLVDEAKAKERVSDVPRASSSLHEETMERIRLVRMLFPTYAAYGSRGYGYRMGFLTKPLESDTEKEGIPISSLPLPWSVQPNSISHGLGSYGFRPDTWSTFVEQVLELRKTVVACLQALRRGLRRYLQASQSLDLRRIGRIRAVREHCRDLVSCTPLLSKSAVDPWGFSYEGRATSSLASSQDKFVQPRAVALQRFRPYLDAEREYTSSLSGFLNQVPSVMETNYEVGKLTPGSSQKARFLEALEENGVRTDLAYLTTLNLSSARRALPPFQHEFRVLFERWADRNELNTLEERERLLFAEVWALWYFFAMEPWRPWRDPGKQVVAELTQTKQRLERKIRPAIDSVQAEGVAITMLASDTQREGSPTLWLSLDIENPVELYERFGQLVSALQNALGQIDAQSLAYYVVEETWQHVGIVPLVRGRMLAPRAWKLSTSSTILRPVAIDDKPLLFIPQPIPEACLKALGLSLWDHGEIEQANLLSESVAALSLLASQAGDLYTVSEVSEGGYKKVASFLEQQSKKMSDLLQTALDMAVSLLDRINALPEHGLHRREALAGAMSDLVALRPLILPSPEHNGESRLSLEQIPEYARRLEKARPLAEEARLLWITDVLDHLSNEVENASESRTGLTGR